jgi:surface antigen
MVVAGLTLGAVPAGAQLLPLLAERAWPGLRADDFERMHAAENRLFEGRSIGTVERWRNPDTSNAGKVELLRKYDVKGTPCRRVSYTIRFAQNVAAQHHYVLNWCRQESGDWKIVSDGPRA